MTASPRSYARVATRARSSSTSLEEGNTAREATDAFSNRGNAPKERRRIARSDLRELVRRVPGNWPPPSDEAIDSLGAEYLKITGKRATPGMHGLLAKTLRVHGPNAPALLQQLYDERGSATNLLADLVAAPTASGSTADAGADIAPADAREKPSETARLTCSDAGGGALGHTLDERIDDSGCYIGLTYGPSDRPPFDPKSRRRYDRPCHSG